MFQQKQIVGYQPQPPSPYTGSSSPDEFGNINFKLPFTSTFFSFYPKTVWLKMYIPYKNAGKKHSNQNPNWLESLQFSLCLRKQSVPRLYQTVRMQAQSKIWLRSSCRSQRWRNAQTKNCWRESSSNGSNICCKHSCVSANILPSVLVGEMNESSAARTKSATTSDVLFD